MDIQLSWPAIVPLLAGMGVLSIARYVWSVRERPGATLWVGVLLTAAAWAISYGIALTVFDPTVRAILEAPIHLGKAMAAPFIFAFALEYTGRGRAVRSKWMAGVFAFFAAAWVLYATNPLHEYMWTGFRIDPVSGAATASYSPEPLLLVVHAVAYLLIGAALVLLLETVLSYGSLYRRQALALTTAIALPTVANLAWLFELGPAPQLDLTPTTFLATGLLTTYALFQEEMFDLLPATRRLAERVAIDDLGIAIVVVSPTGRVINCNRVAADLLETNRREALSRPLSALIDLEVELERTTFTASNPTGNGREFTVTVSPIDGPAAEPLGYSIAFQDVTAERRRRQRLEVLNRVLRHNLRNDTNVIRGKAKLVKREVAGTSLEPAVETETTDIVETSAQLNRVSQKARTIEQALTEAGPERTAVDVRGLVERIVEDLESRFPAAEVDVTVPGDVAVHTDEALLRVILENVLENAIQHDDGEQPRVSVSLREAGGSLREGDGDRREADDGHRGADDEPHEVNAVPGGADDHGPGETGDDHGPGETEDGVVLEVEDEGPGIPEYELAPIRDDGEDPLDHGSGLGLWIVTWGVATLGGEVSFDVEPGEGTTVSIRIPAGTERSPEGDERSVRA